jgi:iron(III) transport system permease protein
MPLACLVIVALGDVGTLGRILVSARTAMLLWNTVVLGTVVAVLAGLAGTALGVLLGRTDLPGRRLLLALLTFPLFLPPYSLALGWFTVLGRQGLLAGALGSAAGVRSSDLLFGLGGAILVLTTAYTPIVLHVVMIALRGVDPASEEAARLRFPWRRVVSGIDLPLVAPAIADGIVLVFVLVVGEFAVPAYLRYPVFSGAVFTQFAAFLDIPAAVVTSLPLAMLVLVGVAVIERSRLGDHVPFLGRTRTTPSVIPLGAWRIGVGLAAWVLALLTVVTPLAGLAREAGGLASYASALRGAWPSIAGSVWMAASAATLMLAAGSLLAYLIARGARLQRTWDTALLLLFATPGTVLGVALILFWNRRGFSWVYGSAAIIVVGYVAHYTPVVVRVVGIGLQGLSRGVEDAARLAGVSWTGALRHVLAPLLWAPLVGAWCLAFIFCLRDLDLVMTIHPAGVETLPIRVYTLMANSPGPVTAALTLVMVLLTLGAVLGAVGGLAMVRRATRWT